MNVTLHKEPFHFITVDNLYDETELDLVMKELEYISSGNKLLHPDECATAREPDGSLLKKAGGIFLDEMYVKREYSNILSVNRKLFTHTQKQFLFHDDSWFFRNQTYNHDSTLVSYYEDGDFYKPHQDDTIITACSWFFKEPKKFKGGNFQFPDYDIEIEIQHNSMCVFPSRTLHAVTDIEMSQEDIGRGYGRYCISQFAKYDNNIK